jgi:hypothetical protein
LQQVFELEKLFKLLVEQNVQKLFDEIIPKVCKTSNTNHDKEGFQQNMELDLGIPCNRFWRLRIVAQVYLLVGEGEQFDC